MCFQRQELITLTKARAMLAALGLTVGTEAYRKASRRFVDTDMFDDETGEPLFYDCDEDVVDRDEDVDEQQHGERPAEQPAVAGAM